MKKNQALAVYCEYGTPYSRPNDSRQRIKKGTGIYAHNFPDAEITVVHVLAPLDRCVIEGYIAYEKIMHKTETALDQGTTSVQKS